VVLVSKENRKVEQTEMFSGETMEKPKNISWMPLFVIAAAAFVGSLSCDTVRLARYLSLMSDYLKTAI
jgi:hypothetical protein